MQEIGRSEKDTFPKKCAYFRRQKKNVIGLALVTVIFGVFLGLAIRNGTRSFIGWMSVFFSVFLLLDICFAVRYGKMKKRCVRYRRIYPVKVSRVEQYLRGGSRYYFEVVCTITPISRKEISGNTELLYSKADAYCAEEAFRKGKLRVYYDPEKEGDRFIFPDI